MISQELTLTTSRFDAALDRVTREVEAKSQRMRRSFQGAGSGAGGIMGGLGSGAAGLGRDLLGAVGVGGGVAGAAMAVKGSLEFADDIADLSLALNDSAESLQRVNFAGKLAAGLGVEDVAASMMKLERALGQAENSKATEALERLGLNIEELQTMSLDDKIVALSDAFQKARATGTGLADITTLLGRSAAELVPLFEQGGEAIRDMYGEAPVLAEQTVQAMAKANDEIDSFIMNAKAGFGSLVGAWTGMNVFLSDVVAAKMGGMTMADAWEYASQLEGGRALDAAADEIEREEKRKAEAKAQARAREEQETKDAYDDEIAAAEAAEKEILKRRKAAQEEANKKKKEREEYQAARFETLTPEQQMEVMLDKIERATGKRTSDQSVIASAADAAAQMGDFQSATNLLGMLATVRGITSRIGGMDRAQAGEQGSMANLMDKIFGRENRELEAIAKNTNASKGTLDNIYQNLLQPPPRDTFDDF